MIQTSIVLPTYNEGENITTLIERVFAALPGAEVIVVDDDSPDRTWERAKEVGERYASLTVERRVGTRGLASAIQTGIGISRGEVVGWLDCDLSMPPESLADMCRAIEDGDLVVGSRYAVGGSDARPFARTFSSRVINMFARGLLRTSSRDLTSGFILARRRVLERFPLSGYYGEYCIGLISEVERAGYRVVEVPYTLTDRTRGSSKTCGDLPTFWQHGIRYIKTILRLWKEARRRDPGA